MKEVSMKNIIKYLGCLALGLLILNKVDFSVYAAEPSKVVRHVEYDEISCYRWGLKNIKKLLK